MNYIPLTQCATFSQGKQVPIGEQSIEKLNGYCRFIRIVDFTSTNEPPRYIKAAAGAFNVSEQDLIMIRYGSQTAGKVVRGISGIIANNMFKIDIDDHAFDKNFAFYYLSSPQIKNTLVSMQSSSTMPAITFGMLDNIQMPLHSLENQCKIGQILQSIDNKISLNTVINNNLEQQAQALITDYTSKIPEVTTFGTLLSFVNGFAFKSSDYLPKGLYKIITIKNVQDGLVDSQGAACMNDLPAKLPSDCKLNIGDVLLSLTGNVGRVGIVTENNLLLNQRVAKVKPKNNDLLPFIYFVLRLPAMKTEMENISKGTAQQNLSPIETLKLQLSFDESTAVDLSHTLSSMFNQIVHNMIQNRNLSEIRDALLPKLMSGEIDVSKVDISDPSCLDKSLFNYVEG